ncbi:molecular chaperone GrpE [Ectothiorhodospira magna]|uniref:Protein GrpE n=1 Tax=Ectothiorhodospira magna TaxID=867345 RepID=A0A1H9CM73_9GAMM|nr:nucleotide exchange factor GrpE [Ectothiorhodospira magna]SEQ02312.1 molecular chaperone GrpE [Ectothiorhodospira magna]
MGDPDKAQLLEQFRAYLDTAPDTLPDPEAPDLFTLLSEMAALKTEVRLESRQFRTALDQFGEVFETLRQSNQRLQEALARQREQAATERQDAETPLLLELLDLRDRLQAGHARADHYSPGWLARRSGAGRFVSGMAEGMAMNLAHLDDMLARREVRPVTTLGQPFDPHTMQAVGTSHVPDQPSGIVTREVRPGFTRQGRVLRTSEVIVNKREIS